MSDPDLTNTIKSAVRDIRQDAGETPKGRPPDILQHVAVIAIIAIAAVAIVAISLRAL